MDKKEGKERKERRKEVLGPQVFSWQESEWRTIECGHKGGRKYCDLESFLGKSLSGERLSVDTKEEGNIATSSLFFAKTLKSQNQSVFFCSDLRATIYEGDALDAFTLIKVACKYIPRRTQNIT
jgi:hypothetical protein